ncbi:MAG: BBE domain-containing protein, partial [Aldersonia sp.]|nr:BBE domain-containing protein [Aldersonia sp.]
MLGLLTMVPDPHLALALEAYLRETREALSPYVTGAAYLNFLEGEERAARATSAFSTENLAGMRRIKATLDPDNRFCHGFGVV